MRASWNAAGSLIEVNWDNVEDPMYSTYYAYVSTEPFDDTRNATLVKAGMRDTILILNEFNEEPVDREATYWVEIVTWNGQVHTYHADPTEVPPWEESSFGSRQPTDDSAGNSWVERILAGEMNMVIAALSVAMLLIGAVLFIKPRDDSAPAPWEMGALEVELEEQLEREAAGLTDDEDFGADDLEIDRGLVAGARRQAGAKTVSDEGADYTATTASAGASIEEDLGPAPAPDTGVVDELLGGNEEDLDLDDLGDLADDLDDLAGLDDLADGLDDDDDLDTSFLDDML